MRIIAILNQKGGVGKTTTAVNLAAALSHRGLLTLLIDLDPQGSATLHCGHGPREIESANSTMGAVLAGRKGIGEIILQLTTTLDLAPGGPSLADADILLARDAGGPATLRDILAGARYDMVVIDCPPHFGPLSVNALVAATDLLIPVQVEVLALDGIPTVLTNLKAARKLNPGLKLHGILPTMFSKTLAVHRRVLADIQATYGASTIVYEPIPRAAAYPQSADEGKITLVSRPNAAGALIFATIAKMLQGEMVHHG